MATGEFVALLDNDDALVPDGTRRSSPTRSSGRGRRDVDYVYTDEAHVLADGRESAHFLKPDWSPERFRSSMYTCHLSVLRRSLVDEIGGFRAGFDGSQDHDLILRATEEIAAAGRRVAAPAGAHLPLAEHRLARCRAPSATLLDDAVENGAPAVQEQCDRLGIDAEVVHGPVEGCYRVVRRVPSRRCRSRVVVASRLEAPTVPAVPAAGAPTTMRSIAAWARCHAPAGVRLVVAHAGRRVPANCSSCVEAELGDRVAHRPGGR